MTEKKRGRPATGLKRDKKVTFMLSEDEFEKVKNFQKKENLTIAKIILKFIENSKKNR